MSPESLFVLMEISACQGLRKELSSAALLSKGNAAAICQQVTNGTWRDLPKAMQKAPASSPHTDGLVVVDQWGNMAVVNHTSRGYWTGIQIDAVTRHMKGGVSPGLEGGVAGY